MLKVRILILGVLVALTSTIARAQTSKGTIAGTVTDPSNAVVAGATVVAQDKQGAETRTVVSGANGEFRIEAITPSIYKLTVSVPNFSKLTVDDIVVKASVVTSVNPQLQVGSTTKACRWRRMLSRCRRRAPNSARISPLRKSRTSQSRVSMRFRSCSLSRG